MAKEIEDNKRKNLSFFHLFMPIAILAVLSFLGSQNTFGGTIILVVSKILVVIWCYTAIKNFVDSVYN